MPENLLTEIKRDSGRVFDFVARVSQDYRSLDEENGKSVYQYGFKYPNSVACATRMATMSEIEEKTIIEMGDESLIRGLKRWRRAIQKRELEMIGNIYEYCRKNAFDTGVFLVGAAHKTGIAKEIEKYAFAESDLIDWNIAYDGQVP